MSHNNSPKSHHNSSKMENPFPDQQQHSNQIQNSQKNRSDLQFYEAISPSKNPADNKGLFVTDLKNQQYLDPKVYKLQDELNTLVQHLESKIDGVIEKHEGEFLIAYKNHMQKIRRELMEMKRKSDEQEKNFHAKDRISGLEKQLVWFREEALKLYNKLEQKNKESDELRMKIQELEKDKIFLEGQVKALMKKGKYMEVKMATLNQELNDTMNNQDNINNEQTNIGDLSNTQNLLNQNDFSYQQYIQDMQMQLEDLKQLVHFSQSCPHSSFVVDEFLKNIFENNNNNFYECAVQIIEYIKRLDGTKSKETKQLKEKSDRLMKEKVQQSVVRSDLEGFFLECVETVRRQVIKRKNFQKDPQALQQQLEDIKDYNIFRMEDKHKILELLVQHEKILLYIYQKIFPTQFNMHIKAVLENEKNSQNQIPQDSLKQNENQYYSMNSNNFMKNSIFEELQQLNINTSKSKQPEPLIMGGRRGLSNGEKLQRITQNQGSKFNNNNQSFDMGNSNKAGLPSSVGFKNTAAQRQRRLNNSFNLDGGVVNNIRKRGVADKVCVYNGKLVFKQI